MKDEDRREATQLWTCGFVTLWKLPNRFAMEAQIYPGPIMDCRPSARDAGIQWWLHGKRFNGSPQLAAERYPVSGVAQTLFQLGLESGIEHFRDRPHDIRRMRESILRERVVEEALPYVRPQQQVGEGSHVYLMDDGDRYKVGLSTDPERRRRNLETMKGRPVRLLATVPGGYELETSLHGALAHLRGIGEWFAREPEVKLAFFTLGATWWQPEDKDFCPKPVQGDGVEEDEADER